MSRARCARHPRMARSTLSSLTPASKSMAPPTRSRWASFWSVWRNDDPGPERAHLDRRRAHRYAARDAGAERSGSDRAFPESVLRPRLRVSRAARPTMVLSYAFVKFLLRKIRHEFGENETSCVHPPSSGVTFGRKVGPICRATIQIVPSHNSCYRIEDKSLIDSRKVLYRTLVTRSRRRRFMRPRSPTARSPVSLERRAIFLGARKAMR